MGKSLTRSEAFKQMVGWKGKRCNVTLKTSRILNHSLCDFFLFIFCFLSLLDFLRLSLIMFVDGGDGRRVDMKENPDGFQCGR